MPQSVSPPPITNLSNLSFFVSSTHFKPVVPVGVLLRNEDEGVIGGVTGGVRLPLAWRGGVAVLFLDTVPVMDRDSLGVAFFFMVSCSRRAASVMNLMTRKRGGGGHQKSQQPETNTIFVQLAHPTIYVSVSII